MDKNNKSNLMTVTFRVKRELHDRYKIAMIKKILHQLRVLLCM